MIKSQSKTNDVKSLFVGIWKMLRNNKLPQLPRKKLLTTTSWFSHMKPRLPGASHDHMQIYITFPFTKKEQQTSLDIF